MERESNPSSQKTKVNQKPKKSGKKKSKESQLQKIRNKHKKEADEINNAVKISH